MASFLEIFRNIPKNNKIVLLGNILEFFDLYLYIHFGIVIAQKFFPAGFEKTVFFQAFGFCQLYLLAPIACLMFAYLGDKHGRKPIIIHTGIIMAVASTLIVFIPTYESWGETAMLLLLILRIIQGVAMAGEPTAAYLYTVESSSIDRDDPFYKQSAWYVRVLTATEELGGILALLVCLLALHLSKQYEHAWRLPFIFCVFSVGFLLFARVKLTENSEYVNATSNKSGVNMFEDGDNGFLFLKKVMVFSKRNLWCLIGFLLPYPIVFNVCMLQISPQVVGAEAGLADLMTYNIYIALGSIVCNLVSIIIALKLKWDLRNTVCHQVFIGLTAAFMAIWGLENGLNTVFIYCCQILMMALVNFTILRPGLLKVMPVVGRYSLMGIAWGLARFSGFFMMVFIIPYIKLNFGLYGCFYLLFGICAIAIFATWYHVSYYNIDAATIKISINECNKSGMVKAYTLTEKEVENAIIITQNYLNERDN